ncbi:MAG: tryptophan-rich sensory protein [Trueperaceae bacterium]
MTGAAAASPSTDLGLRLAVIASVVAVIGMNVAANALPLFGRATGAISDAYPTPFTPAGYVFSIWGVIYLGQIVYAVWQATPAGRADPRTASVAPWVIASGAMNVSWLILWHAELVAWAVLPIVALLSCVAVVYEKLRAAPSKGDPAADSAGVVRWTAQIPFAIYFGWLSVATIANVAVAGVALGWQGAPFGAEAWAGLMILVATLLGVRMLQARAEPAFALVLIWAFVGIAVEVGLPSVLAFTAAVASALLAGGIAGRLVRRGGRRAAR